MPDEIRVATYTKERSDTSAVESFVADQPGWTITRTYTAGRRQQAGLGSVARDAHAGMFDTVVVASLYSMGRNLGPILDLTCALREAGVRFISVKDRIDTAKPMDQFQMVLLRSCHQWEQAMSARSRQARKGKA